MNCMKCGKEIPEKQVFCDECLQDMQRYPVKPEVRVQLPPIPVQTLQKKAAPRKRAVPPEEKIALLKKAVGWLTTSLVAAVLALILAVALLVHACAPQDDGEDHIGQNYSAVDRTEEMN